MYFFFHYLFLRFVRIKRMSARLARSGLVRLYYMYLYRRKSEQKIERKGKKIPTCDLFDPNSSKTHLFCLNAKYTFARSKMFAAKEGVRSVERLKIMGNDYNCVSKTTMKTILSPGGADKMST